MRSSELAIKAKSYSYGAIRARLPGAILRFAKVKAASLLIFSSVTPDYGSQLPAAIKPISLSMHLC